MNPISRWTIRLWIATALTAPHVFAQAQVPGPGSSEPPALLEFVPAAWPVGVPETSTAVAVLLELVIDHTGNVSEAELVSVLDTEGRALPEDSALGFSEAAQSAALRCTFTPAMVNNEAVASRIRFRYDFAYTAPAPIPIPEGPAYFGTIVDMESGVPLAGVEVRIADDVHVTDGSGGFAFNEVADTEFDVELYRDPDIGPVLVAERSDPGSSLQVVYRVEVRESNALQPGVLMEIVVRPPSPNLAASGTRVTADSARGVPGTSGDVVRVVESMPGVARAGAGQGTLVVWGASPEDTRVYMDGVPLPRLYHESGVRSVVHPQFVESISLIPGGWGAPWGRGLGGIVLVDTRSPTTEGVSGVLGADAYDASGALTWSNRNETSAGVAGRVGVIRPLARQFAADTQEFVPVPQFWDLQSRFAIRTGVNQELTVAGIVSGDEVQRGLDSPDPARIVRETRDLTFARVYANYASDSAKSTFEFAPWVGVESQSARMSVGPAAVGDARTTWSAGARVTQRAALTPAVRLAHGADVEWTRSELTRSGSLALPPREGDPRAFGQLPPDQQTSDDFAVQSLSLAWWGEARVTNRAESIRLTTGLRLDPYIQTASRRTPVSPSVPEVGTARSDLRLEPRVQFEADPTRALTLRSAFGQYHQFAAASDLSAVFGTPTLPVSRARHLLAGATLRLGEHISVEATAFHSWSFDIAVRNPDASPPVAQALVNEGEGRARGVQVLVRRELDHGLFGWVAWTISRAQRRNSSGTQWRLFDYDQTHVGTGVFGWQPTPRWDFSLRARYATGLPRTDVVSADFDATRDRYEPRFGRINGIRLPAFAQLDVRAAHTLPLSTGKLLLYLEILNVTNRENAEELVYSPDYSERGEILGLPVLPFAGLQWSF